MDASVPDNIFEEGSGYGSRRRSPFVFPRLSLLLICLFTLSEKKTGTRRPRVNMAAGQERLISLAELQAFRIAGVKERNVENL